MNEQDDIAAMAIADAAEKSTEAVSDDALGAVGKLAKEQVELEDKIANLEEQLKTAKAQLTEVAERRLPDALLDLGSKGFTMDSGFSVTVEKKYLASIKKADEDAAFQWLDDNQHGGIIKAEVKTDFGKGGRHEAIEFANNLRAQNPDLSVQLAQSVHWSTLRAFAKEQIELGVELPETFSVYEQNRAKITRK